MKACVALVLLALCGVALAETHESVTEDTFPQAWCLLQDDTGYGLHTETYGTCEDCHKAAGDLKAYTMTWGGIRSAPDVTMYPVGLICDGLKPIPPPGMQSWCELKAENGTKLSDTTWGICTDCYKAGLMLGANVMLWNNVSTTQNFLQFPAETLCKDWSNWYVTPPAPTMVPPPVAPTAPVMPASPVPTPAAPAPVVPPTIPVDPVAPEVNPDAQAWCLLRDANNVPLHPETYGTCVDCAKAGANLEATTMVWGGQVSVPNFTNYNATDVCKGWNPILPAGPQTWCLLRAIDGTPIAEPTWGVCTDCYKAAVALGAASMLWNGLSTCPATVLYTPIVGVADISASPMPASPAVVPPTTPGAPEAVPSPAVPVVASPIPAAPVEPASPAMGLPPLPAVVTASAGDAPQAWCLLQDDTGYGLHTETYGTCSDCHAAAVNLKAYTMKWGGIRSAPDVTMYPVGLICDGLVPIPPPGMQSTCELKAENGTMLHDPTFGICTDCYKAGVLLGADTMTWHNITSAPSFQSFPANVICQDWTSVTPTAPVAPVTPDVPVNPPTTTEVVPPTAEVEVVAAPAPAPGQIPQAWCQHFDAEYMPLHTETYGTCEDCALAGNNVPGSWMMLWGGQTSVANYLQYPAADICRGWLPIPPPGPQAWCHLRAEDGTGVADITWGVCEDCYKAGVMLNADVMVWNTTASEPDFETTPLAETCANLTT